MTGRPEVRPERGWFHVRKEDLHSRSARETDPPFAAFDVALRGDYEDLAERVLAQERAIEAARDLWNTHEIQMYNGHEAVSGGHIGYCSRRLGTELERLALSAGSSAACPADPKEQT